MFLDQEMSKEKDSKFKHNPTNVVAKLMGLDTLSKGEPNLSVVRRSHREDYSKQFGDVDEGKMALIRRKFMEVKRLSTDERLRKSKQFGDALEVLSSNSDLLVRFLDSQKLYELPSTPKDESKRITLVKPLKMVENDKYAAAKGKKSDKRVKKPTNTNQETIWQNRKIPEYSSESPKFDEFSVQSTRIVLLKPSPGRTHEIKDLASPTIPSPQSFYQATEDDDELESIKVAKEITRQMQEGLKSYQKDDKTLNSSVFSNGYSSDESSFNKSYHEYAAEKLSDLEAMSPLTRHSWDCINGCRSPYSTLSLGRASCSPESSVCIEAKKRLSERWTMITSTDKGHQEQRNVRRSSTLGEMLSLSLAKKHVSVKSEVESTTKDHEPSKSVSCSHSLNEEMSIDENSVPESSTDEKTNGSKVLTKSKSTKSSFKGKVASFLFSRNKKSSKKKSSSSKSKDEPQSTVTETIVLPANDVSQGLNSGNFEECSLAALCESSGKTPTDSVSNGQQLHKVPTEPVSKPVVPEISISVLEPPFEDYNNTTHLGSSHSGVAQKSNLIDKSPPIESIARTLSWGDSCEDLANQYPLKLKRVSSLDTTTNIEEKEWFILVQKLLSAAGLDDEEDYNRWYSIESPLDPSLRDTYANLSDKETHPYNEAKRRKIRSKQKLVFDCVNDALLEVVGYGSENYYFNRPLVQKGTFTLSPLLMGHIMAQMKELIANGMKWENCGDNHSLVVENVVKKEVMEIKWDELIRLEIDILGREIEGMLIQELVENVVIDFIA